MLPSRTHTAPHATAPQTWSRPVPRGPFLPAPHDAVPHDATPQTTRPHSSARNSQLDGFLPSELLLRVSDKVLGKTEEKLRGWGKLSTTKEPGARK